jgi:hypothetical protein
VMGVGSLIEVTAMVGLGLSAIPAALTAVNLTRFRHAPRGPTTGEPVSILIPARDEAGSIEQTCRAIMASDEVRLELVILDDDSQDDTAGIVSRLAEEDPRVRLIRGRPLPAGWCGKQHACSQLAEAARYDLLLFLDADVSLKPDAIRRTIAFLEESGVALASGFPRQLTGTPVEWLLLPLIQYVLLGFLPLAMSRQSLSPGLAAGCGQLFLTRRCHYEAAGGHAAIRESLHDGIKLPRAYRRAGLTTDLFDASDLAECRMYTRGVDVLQGLSKNATEGMATPQAVVPATVLLFGGQVLPALLLATGIAVGWSWQGFSPLACGAIVAAVLFSVLTRVVEAVRFRSSVLSSFAHPLAILMFLGIQWFGLIRRAAGLKATWKGRSLSPQ